MTTASRRLQRVAVPETFVDAMGSVRAVEVLRIALGPVVIAHLWPFLQDATKGIVYSDRFYLPYVSWYPEVPRTLYLVLLWAAVATAVMLCLGLATRVAAIYTAAFVGYNLFLSRTFFWHNRAFLLVMLVGVSILPLGRAMSVDALIRKRRGLSVETQDVPLWPLYLMRFEVVAAFAGSGLSKLVDDDWWGGTVTRLRIVQWRSVALDRGVPDWLLDLLASEGFHWWFAKFAVLIELGIAVGLVWKTSRLAAIWVAIGFHVSIEILASVQVFSAIALAALVIWITPKRRDRRVVVRRDTAAGRRVAGLVRVFDWTGRFEVAEAPRRSGPPVALIDRGGVRRVGRDAVVAILTRLPATFPVFAPIRLFWGNRSQGGVEPAHPVG